ncbi:hypothetical protein ACIQGZ_02295 [Streptomyces sp. NPDC092296]|uniref:hypothetical protein n=1 Tax=Streptomyces sp. NPDC092296 TaxID=3366012 RepID=UPI00380439C0
MNAAAQRVERQGEDDGKAGLDDRESPPPIGSRAVIYVNSLPGEQSKRTVERALLVANARRWLVVGVAHDQDGAGVPLKRRWLRDAIEQVRSGQASVILVTSRSAVSPLAKEWDEIAKHVRQAGGVLWLERAG